METTEKIFITVAAIIKAPVEKVWKLWTEPQHITQWNNASDDWHTPHAENDLKEGGRFRSKMAARDGSNEFDFSGTYSKIIPQKLIEFTLDDGRKVQIVFDEKGDETSVTEVFEAEHSFSADMQQTGWQSILTNFKKYAESASGTENYTSRSA